LLLIAGQAVDSSAWLAIDDGERVGALALGATTAGDERGLPRSDQASVDLMSGAPEAAGPPVLPRRSTREDAAFFDQPASRRIKCLHRAASREHDAWDELHRVTAPTARHPWHRSSSPRRATLV